MDLSISIKEEQRSHNQKVYEEIKTIFTSIDVRTVENPEGVTKREIAEYR